VQCVENLFKIYAAKGDQRESIEARRRVTGVDSEKGHICESSEIRFSLFFLPVLPLSGVVSMPIPEAGFL
jgi:hypothetical protein